LVPEQVLHFFGLKPYKNAIFKGSCSETEVSEQLYYKRLLLDWQLCQNQ